jgi:hypothetical protein
MKKLIPLVTQVPQRVKLTRHLYLSNLGDINLWYDSKWVWYLPVLYLPYQDPTCLKLWRSTAIPVDTNPESLNQITIP